MRFAEPDQALDFIADRINEEPDAAYDVRYESGTEHPNNETAVGQIWHDGGWMDYARDTPEKAIAWAKREPVGLARVVDWIGKRDVIWPHRVWLLVDDHG
jgi:hypothetical protein